MALNPFFGFLSEGRCLHCANVAVFRLRAVALPTAEHHPPSRKPHGFACSPLDVGSIWHAGMIATVGATAINHHSDDDGMPTNYVLPLEHALRPCQLLFG